MLHDPSIPRKISGTDLECVNQPTIRVRLVLKGGTEVFISLMPKRGTASEVLGILWKLRGKSKIFELEFCTPQGVVAPGQFVDAIYKDEL